MDVVDPNGDQRDADQEDATTKFERFTDLARRLVTVPKSETNGKRPRASRSADPK